MRSHVKKVLLVTCALRVRCVWMRVLSAQVGWAQLWCAPLPRLDSATLCVLVPTLCADRPQ